MIRRIAPLAFLLCFPLSSAALAQEEPPQPAVEEPQSAVDQLIDIYATVLFASEIERRCDHLDEGMEVVFFNNLITIENYMAGVLPPRAMSSIRQGAAGEAANEQVNPCGDATREFISRVFPMAANVALNIMQDGSQQPATGESADDQPGESGVPQVTLGEGEETGSATEMDLSKTDDPDDE